jgi:hypothetical protein
MKPICGEQGRVGGERARRALFKICDATARFEDGRQLPLTEQLTGLPNQCPQSHRHVRNRAEVWRRSDHNPHVHGDKTADGRSELLRGLIWRDEVREVIGPDHDHR